MMPLRMPLASISRKTLDLSSHIRFRTRTKLLCRIKLPSRPELSLVNRSPQTEERRIVTAAQPTMGLTR
jgi:hypothetical protein